MSLALLSSVLISLRALCVSALISAPAPASAIPASGEPDTRPVPVVVSSDLFVRIELAD